MSKDINNNFFKSNYDYGEGAFFGTPKDLRKWKKRKKKRIRRVALLKIIAGLK
jgi:hypothetical protein